MLRLALALLALAAVAVPGTLVQAETVVVEGSDGADGADGVGTPGEDGEPGEPADAAAVAPDSVNRATAEGGWGGEGGFGGVGVTVGQPGGSGGAGGAADATAEADVSSGTVAEARTTALGGRGGQGNIGGLGLIAPFARGASGDGGDGGDANASSRARLTGDGGAVFAGGTFPSFQAQGGQGGAAFSGGQPGEGGDARAEATAEATGSSRSEAQAVAVGGRGGSALDTGPASAVNGATGGVAEANAHASNQGSAPVFATADALGGTGGFGRGSLNTGGDGGTATARASGTSTGGGAVSVIAEAEGGEAGGDVGGRGGDGGAVELLDAATGSTTGLLTIRQTALGGSGVGGGDGGDASSSLTHTGALGRLTVRVDARGGNAQRSIGDIPGGNGGDAFASGVVGNVSADPVRLWVFPSAGDGAGVHGVPSGVTPGAGGNGGVATLGDVYASSSGGGDVEVLTSVRGGSGEQSFSHALTGGDGASVSLVDAIGGSTTGSLRLTQEAIAGNGGDIDAGSGFPPFAPGVGGDGGDATSMLTRDAAGARSIELEAFALAGSAGESNTEGDTTRAGAAQAAAIATNGDGGAGASAVATGGGGNVSRSGPGGLGGAARAEARATGGGDGHVVSAFGEANAGPGGTIRDGPEAESLVCAEALGDSTVVASSEAVGGRGGSNFSFALDDAGHGGAARAEASGSNAGVSSVEVTARAEGGEGGRTWGNGGNGAEGFARATGSSTGGGAVRVWVTQEGGGGGLTEVATGGLGAESILENAATGSTSGNLTLIQEAIGGAGGSAFFEGSVPIFGRVGAQARSSLIVDHEGLGSLTLHSAAQGGRGGNGRLEGAAGRGGPGQAIAHGTGHAAVTIEASARGGAPGLHADPTMRPMGGDAFAQAHALSTAAAPVSSSAVAISSNGAGSAGGPLADAIAEASSRGQGPTTSRAIATGASGWTTALAESSPEGGMRLLAASESLVRGSVFTTSATAYGDQGGALRDLPSEDVYAAVRGLPGPLTVASMFAASADLLVDLGGADPLAAIVLRAGMQNHDAGESLTYEASVEFALPSVLEAEESLVLAWLGSDVDGSGFDELHFWIETEAQRLVDEAFTDVLAATAFFDARLATLLAPGAAAERIRIGLAVTTDEAGSAFMTKLVFAAVPEPGAAVLFAVLLVRVLRSRR